MAADALTLAVEAAGFHIDRRRGPRGNRFLRAQRLVTDGLVVVTLDTPARLEADVNYKHKAAIRLDEQGGVANVTCTCQDWRTRGLHHSQPCKHILALAMEVGDIPTQVTSPTVAAAPQPERSSRTRFGDQVRQAIGRAIADLASQAHTLLLAGKTPFLLGPTGCGKTSAIRQVAIDQGWAFEEVAGAQSFVDADLVGLRTDHMEVPGVFARAFRRAQQGETVLLLLDELTRFNERVPDLLMRPLQVASVEVAQAMGLAATEPIRLCEAPTWGQIWAPAVRVKLVLAANPWGSALDAALVRRVQPLPVAFAQPVLDLFTSPVRDAIETSWKAEAEGQLPLPVEYQALLDAEGPDDANLFRPYLTRLRVIDRAAAEGYHTLLKGMGIQISD